MRVNSHSRQQRNASTCFSNLPGELKSLILSKVNDRNTQTNVRLAGSELNQLITFKTHPSNPLRHLENFRVTPDIINNGFNHLLNYLRSDRCQTDNLDLSDLNLSGTRLIEIMQALTINPRITSLNLSNCNLSNIGFGALLNYLSFNICQIHTLNLRGIDLSGSKLTALINALTINPRITSLNLSNCNLSDVDLVPMAGLVNLTYLDISENNIEDNRTAHIATIPNLIYLNISNNNIGDTGAIHLSTLTQLQNLDITHNNIGDLGATALAQLETANNIQFHW